MNKIIFLLVALMIFVSGCSDEEIGRAIMGDIPFIGWIINVAGDDYEISGEDNSPSKNDSDLIKVVINNAPEIKCPPNQYWHMYHHICMCEQDYYMQDGICILKSSRECSVDRDCSPSGVLSECVDNFKKRMYYCDLNTYRCVNGKFRGVIVDCRSEYGSDYKCRNGNCVSS
jgi:hypothetical protein